MNGLHKCLERNVSWYDKWHRHARYGYWHWLVFAAVASMLTASAVSGISQMSASQDAEAAGAALAIDQAADKADLPVLKTGVQGAEKDQILVKFKKDVSLAKKNQVLSRHGLSEKAEIKQLGVKILKVPALKTAEQAISDLKSQDMDSLEYAEPDYIQTINLVPNDPSYPNQWHLAKISGPQGWDIGTGSSSTVVAIIDTGVDPTHPELAGKLVPGYNFVYGNTDTHDLHGHGTATAGTAAAIGNNGLGVASVSWRTRVMPVLVCDSGGSCSSSNIINGILYAADHGANVASMSFGGSSYSSAQQDAINYAWNKGLVLVASAGNNGYSNPNYPAALEHVIAAAATDSSDARSSFSNYGSWVDVAAPGSSILTTNRGGGWGYWSGTSFSAPVVSGLASLVLAANPALTNMEAVNVIIQNTDDLGAAGFDQYFGWGRVNVYKALLGASQYVKDTVAPSAPANLVGQVTNTYQVSLSWTAASDDVGIAGYQVFRDNVQIGIASSALYVDNSVSTGKTYTYTVRAFDSSNNLSEFSNAAQVTVPAAPVTLTITKYSVSNKTGSSAMVNWNSNVPSTGTVSFGTSSNNLSQTATDSNQTTVHKVLLTGLSPNTTYYYKVTASGADGSGTASTPTASFKTSRK